MKVSAPPPVSMHPCHSMQCVFQSRAHQTLSTISLIISGRSPIASSVKNGPLDSDDLHAESLQQKKCWLKETWSVCERSWQAGGRPGGRPGGQAGVWAASVADVPDDYIEYKHKAVKSIFVFIKRRKAVNVHFLMTHFRHLTCLLGAAWIAFSLSFFFFGEAKYKYILTGHRYQLSIFLAAGIQIQNRYECKRRKYRKCLKCWFLSEY